MDNTNRLEGEVDSLIYQNEDNGYCVFSVINQQDGDEIVCTANISSISPGETVVLLGSYVNHPSYGRQFNVSSFETSIPITLQGMQKYLGSGAIKGIGERMAERIISKFGEESFDIIESRPERLSEIKGISLKRAQEISSLFHEKANERMIMAFLQSYGVSPSLSTKIYKKYGPKTAEIVKRNPYRLSEEIPGIGFKTMDTIAGKLGVDFASIYRIKSGISYCLSLGALNGHTYLPKEELIAHSCELLGVSAEATENALIEMQVEKSIIQANLSDGIGVFLNSFFYAENYVAKKLLEISSNRIEKPENVFDEIEELEEILGITLARNQKYAVSEAMTGGVLVITGGPGTGKTTTLNAIIALLKKRGLEIELCAPTGRAAKRMSEATGEPAKTLHRLLEVKFLSDDSRRQNFDRNEDNPIEADVVIIDESSMVDIMLMFSFLRALDPATSLILVGDADQLPSVGPGNVLKDIIASGSIRTVRLDEIFRQAQESHIVINAHRINKGEYPVLNADDSDFFLVRRNSMPEVEFTIIDLIKKRLPKFKGYDSMTDIQVLSPMKKSLIGVISLNQALQKALNPPTQYKNEYEFRNIIFREGDKVMQIKNNYSTPWSTFDESGRLLEEDLGIFNGDEGIIKAINLKTEYMTVVFDDSKTVKYPFSQLDELDLGYAATIHKSQGSEYKAIIIPVHSGPALLLNRNLIYTGVTRAKEMVILVGTEEAIKKMVDNNKEINRYSSLDLKIKKFSSLLTKEGKE